MLGESSEMPVAIPKKLWGFCLLRRRRMLLILNLFFHSSLVPDLMDPSKPVLEFLVHKVLVYTLLSMARGISNAFFLICVDFIIYSASTLLICFEELSSFTLGSMP